MSGWKPSKLTRAQQEERRLAAKEWLQQGTFSRQAIAEHFGVSIHTVGTWVTRLNQQRTLEATVATGRPSRLTDEQREEIRTLLREGSRHHGYPDESWTTARVRDVIGRHLGIWYHRDHVRKLLHALGFTPQMPDGRAAERNEFRIASWKEQVAPELKKKGR